MRQFRPYQTRAFEYACSRKTIALFMEMRLGKTMVAIRWADRIPGRKLVLAPLTVLQTWEEELYKEEKKKSEVFSGRDVRYFTDGWVLLNYEALLSNKIICNVNWAAVLCDESTKIRNPQAQISKLAAEQFPHVQYRAILSGLPAPESPMDYYQQFKFLNGSFLGFNNFWNFRRVLFFQGWNGYSWEPKKGVVERIKKEVHKLSFVLTRKEAGVGPIKIYEKRYVSMSGKQKKLYKEVEETFSYTDGDIKLATNWATVKFGWMARIAGGFSADGKSVLSTEKVKEILSLLNGELKNQQIVIWFRYNRELYYALKFLRQHKIKCLSISGKTPKEERTRRSNRFRGDKNIQAMLCQTKVGQYSLNWSHAPTAIYYSNYYDGEVRAQSEERILDVDKKEPLLIMDLVTKGTLDEAVCRVLKHKFQNSRQFMVALVEDWLKNREKKSG